MRNSGVALNNHFPAQQHSFVLNYLVNLLTIGPCGASIILSRVTVLTEGLMRIYSKLPTF